MKVVYRGNFQPQQANPWSTEVQIAEALESLGHVVIRCQEDDTPWEEQVRVASDCDLFAWTRTPRMDHWDGAHEAISELNDQVMTLGLHLDRWFGLAREHEVGTSAFFRLRVVATADGDADWESRGIHHIWMPPAVPARYCWRYPAEPEIPAVFVGSWRRYHREWRAERMRLVQTVAVLGGRIIESGCYNECLNEVVSRAHVTVGDSCQATSSRYYWSDRAVMTVGRGGLLAHRFIEGLAEMFQPGVHALYWHEVEEIPEIVRWAQANPKSAEAIRRAGLRHCIREHTWERRIAQLLRQVFS